MNDMKASKTAKAIEEFKFWVMGVSDRRTAIAELCAIEREYNLPQSIVQELLQHIKSYFPTIPPATQEQPSPISIKVDQDTIPDSLSMAKTLRNMRATGITQREIPAARRNTKPGIPAKCQASWDNTPERLKQVRPPRRSSLVFGTPDRFSSYSVQDCAEERIF